MAPSQPDGGAPAPPEPGSGGAPAAGRAGSTGGLKRLSRASLQQGHGAADVVRTASAETAPTALRKQSRASSRTGGLHPGCALYDLQLEEGEEGIGALWTAATLQDGSCVLRLTPVPGGALQRAGVPAASVVRSFDGVSLPSPLTVADAVRRGSGRHRLVVDRAFDERRWPQDAYEGPVEFHVPLRSDGDLVGIELRNCPEGCYVYNVAPDSAGARAHIPSPGILEAVGRERVSDMDAAARVTTALRRRGAGTLLLRIRPLRRQNSMSAASGVVPVASLVHSEELAAESAAAWRMVEAVHGHAPPPPAPLPRAPAPPRQTPAPPADAAVFAAPGAGLLLRCMRRELEAVARAPGLSQQWRPAGPPDGRGHSPPRARPGGVVHLDLQRDPSRELHSALQQCYATLHQRLAAHRAAQLETAAELQRRLRSCPLPPGGPGLPDIALLAGS